MDWVDGECERSADDGAGARLGAVPLFPLPNVVLFPRAILPLHIFEERYKTMTADAISGDRLIAMALLKPGWEKSYYGRPEIEPVLCVGRILTHEKLADGKYNFLLQGELRARIVKEHDDHAYRVAELTPLGEPHVMEIDLSHERGRLLEMFSQEIFSAVGLVKQFREMLLGPMCTGAIADLLAFNLLDDVREKQSLLEETDVRRRVGEDGTIERVFEKVKPPGHDQEVLQYLRGAR